MRALKKLVVKYFVKYREMIAYLFFGGVTTLVNIATYALLSRAGLSTGLANAIAWAVGVAVAYVSNRLWVFHSQSRGVAAAKEFLSFVACRLGTFALDEGVMLLGVDVLGPRLVPPSRQYLWSLGVKVFANILVIILNYVFSKLFIFKGNREEQ